MRRGSFFAIQMRSGYLHLLLHWILHIAIAFSIKPRYERLGNDVEFIIFNVDLSGCTSTLIFPFAKVVALNVACMVLPLSRLAVLSRICRLFCANIGVNKINVEASNATKSLIRIMVYEFKMFSSVFKS